MSSRDLPEATRPGGTAPPLQTVWTLLEAGLDSRVRVRQTQQQVLEARQGAQGTGTALGPCRTRDIGSEWEVASGYLPLWAEGGTKAWAHRVTLITALPSLARLPLSQGPL